MSEGNEFKGNNYLGAKERNVNVFYEAKVTNEIEREVTS
mgnify:CR=1 FL=1